jgi:L-aspartate oxidase
VIETDVLIIGTGVGGATAALQLARNPQRQIVVLTRDSDPEESNTRYAQGGIVARGPDDSAESLVADVLEAGAGACLRPAVELLAAEGPRLVDELLVREAGVAFDRSADGGLDWGQEGAHSHRRILHVGDTTGQAVERGLIARLRGRPNVRLITGATAIDLITYPHHSRDPRAAYRAIACHGAYVFDRAEGAVHRFLAKTTVLATGGLGRIYRYTTNAPGARGDGLAMAHRAGARIANAEYVQFHPTSLAAPGAEGFLISEAVRGEGARLLTPDGRPFMEAYAPEWKDLAPRDIVARAIHLEMEAHGYSHVLLDLASAMPPQAIRERFPSIHRRCLEAGFDLSTEPVPVVPAAHYFCGGVLVDDRGRSTIDNLFAVGEVSCTGVHGANRLASTSLLEGLVWGSRAAEAIESDLQPARPEARLSPDDIPRWDETGLEADPDPALIQGDLQTIQTIMWNYVGLVRSSDGLSRAIRELRHMWNEIETFYRTTKLGDGLIGLRNAVEVALIVAEAARHNRRSRGCHFRRDAMEGGGDRLI